MIDIAAGFVATFVTLPVLALVVIFYLTKQATKKNLLALKRAVDCTVILFMLSVYFIILETWNIDTGWWILLLLLLTTALFTVYHWRNYEEIYTGRLIRGVWRLQFIIYFSLYWILVMAGLFMHMLT